ncbi:MAG: S8 family serine peptidase [Streptomyces sp.]|uniref:S8 family serine peptidase n=1 Tax=Streptomyces sp. TaxID=1931 RepID=UPI0025CC35D6|nr:S8 family serine peptidase [Streptomyces sp.]MBW8801124.1 S8 family serine peptidase [Streptomyces sp.]
MRRVALAASLVAVSGALTAPALAAASGTPAAVHVLVTGTSPAARAEVARAVTLAGGHVDRSMAVIDGVSATVPAAALSELRAAAGVRSVTVDGKGHLQGLDSTLGYDVGGDDGSLYNIGQITHAKDAWSHGWTGKGVDVALIDSGVVPVKGLTSGNVIQGPDLSFESQDPALEHLDTFGHGTHMASIIAGRDTASTGSFYAKGDSHSFNGVAPDARLVSLKVAAADGGSDVSQVIAAIDWVTQHARSGGLNIKVLNLSYGTDSKQDPALDPLDYAVENAWRAGITVVVSSGNDGANGNALADPANDPLVLAIGADDPNGSDSVGDDTVPAFAQKGTPARYVDMIAPGVHVLGLRNPGSSADLGSPTARVGNRFFRGSGTSQSAAVVSGLAALYLQKYPSATPDQVKKALMATASVPSSVKSTLVGVGVPDVNKAIGAALPSLSAATQLATGARGTGSLEAARGSSHVSNGIDDLVGEQDIFGNAWDGAAWSSASAARTSWSGGSWRGNDVTAAGAGADGSWDGHAWSSNDWTGHAWSGHAWSGHAWSDSGWDGHAWSDSCWDGSTWSAAGWSTDGWQAWAWG